MEEKKTGLSICAQFCAGVAKFEKNTKKLFTFFMAYATIHANRGKILLECGQIISVQKNGILFGRKTFENHNSVPYSEPTLFEKKMRHSRETKKEEP